MSACDGRAWTAHDADGYFNATWQPGRRAGGAECTSMTRFGPPWMPCPTRELAVHAIRDNPRKHCVAKFKGNEATFASVGDGGKTICEAETLLRPPGCLVVSVGINANTEFEEALHQAHPQCRIIGYDGTLNSVKRARAHARAPFLELHEQNFDARLAANYSGASVQLLKVSARRKPTRHTWPLSCQTSLTTTATYSFATDRLRWVRVQHASCMGRDCMHRPDRGRDSPHAEMATPLARGEHSQPHDPARRALSDILSRDQPCVSLAGHRIFAGAPTSVPKVT